MFDVIKQLALDVMEGHTYSGFCIGEIQTVNPLSVVLEDNLMIEERFLILSEYVTTFEERGKIRTWTSTEGDTWSEYRLEVDRELKVGEKVCLIKDNGGQRYFIIDRIDGGRILD